MTRTQVLATLREHKGILARRFGVSGLTLFGSFARDQGTQSSDVDIIVQFDAPPDWRRYFGTHAYLDDLLDRRVDMVTNNELRAEFRPFAERDAIDI